MRGLRSGRRAPASGCGAAGGRLQDGCATGRGIATSLNKLTSVAPEWFQRTLSGRCPHVGRAGAAQDDRADARHAGGAGA
eukprot:11562652-Alexandrium_andersonii.AAC.1